MDAAPFALDFKHKNIFITGGSRGIGRACAQLFASLGANVIISYKTARQEADLTLASLGELAAGGQGGQAGGSWPTAETADGAGSRVAADQAGEVGRNLCMPTRC